MVQRIQLEPLIQIHRHARLPGHLHEAHINQPEGGNRECLQSEDSVHVWLAIKLRRVGPPLLLSLPFLRAIISSNNITKGCDTLACTDESTFYRETFFKRLRSFDEDCYVT